MIWMFCQSRCQIIIISPIDLIMRTYWTCNGGNNNFIKNITYYWSISDDMIIFFKYLVSSWFRLGWKERTYYIKEIFSRCPWLTSRHKMVVNGHPSHGCNHIALCFVNFPFVIIWSFISIFIFEHASVPLVTMHDMCRFDRNRTLCNLKKSLCG